MGPGKLLREDRNWNEIQNGKNIFDYFREYPVLEHYNMDDEQDVDILCRDFNEYAGTKCNREDFLFAARYWMKITSRPGFSFFRKPVYNTRPSHLLTISQVYDLIIEEKHYKALTEEYWKLNAQGKANNFKSTNFDYVTFSGTFSKRHSSALVKHSGLMVIDIDHVKDVEKTKTTLLNDEKLRTELLFVSPGGNGIKWVIQSYPEKYEHAFFFQGVSAYLKKRYAIETDQSGKDLARACFICYDPNVYLNPQYL